MTLVVPCTERLAAKAANVKIPRFDKNLAVSKSLGTHNP